MYLEFWRLLKPFHRTFLKFAIIIFIYESLQIGESYLLSGVIRLHELNAPLSSWILLFVGILAFDEFFNRLDNQVDWQIIHHHSQRVYQYLKTEAQKKFARLTIVWHAVHNSGALVGKVGNGVGKASEIIDQMSWEFVPTAIQTLLSLVPLTIFSPLSSLIAVLGFSLFMWITLLYNRFRKPYQEQRHDGYEEEWRLSIEMVQSIETAISFEQAEALLQRHQNAHQEILDAGYAEFHRGTFFYNRWRIRVLSWSRRLVLAIWIYQLHLGTLDVANLIFLSTVSEKLFHSFWRFARLLDRASDAKEGVGRLVRLMKETEADYETGDKKELNGAPEIRLENVCFSYTGNYDQKNQLGQLHNLDLTIKAGEIVALVGPSGAGKTTIRRVLTRLVEIQSGDVYVGGVSIKAWQHKALLRQFSYVPQGDDVYIYTGTIAQNIAFPKPHAHQSEIESAAQLAGIHDFILSLPDGYSTTVGERGKRLSGGQKQRVALARAIIANRPILILDEATSAVDAITEEEIQGNMRQILKDKTAIIIAHRLSTVWNLANQIVVMNDGHIVEKGTHESLVAQNGLYAKMANLQTKDGH